AGALGSLAAGLPDALAPARAAQAERAAFLVYGAIGALSAFAYRKLSAHLEPPRSPDAGAALKQSRGGVLQLATLFSVDAFGGGFVVQSIVALWLFRRFDLAVSTAGAIFFAVNLLSAFSQLVSARIAARIGHVRTMVYTHLPANVFLVLAGLMPTLPLAALFLLLRAMLSQMDVPARQAYVMAMVPREEPAAAASGTNASPSPASPTRPPPA